MKRNLINRDELTNQTGRNAANASFVVINELQNYQPHEQIIAAGAVFIMLAEAFRENPVELFHVTERILLDERTGINANFNAVRDYIKHELVKG